MHATSQAAPAALDAGLTLAEHQAIRAIGLHSTTGRTTTHWCWPLHDHRAGHYAVCPRDPSKPLSLAVCDDFGTLVPVPSVGAHEGFAGVPA